MNFNTVSGTEFHIYQNKTVYRNDDIISDGIKILDSSHIVVKPFKSLKYIKIFCKTNLGIDHPKYKTETDMYFNAVFGT